MSTTPDDRIVVLGLKDLEYAMAGAVRAVLRAEIPGLLAASLAPLESAMSEITDALKQIKQAATDDAARQRQAIADRDAQIKALDDKIAAGLSLTDEDRALITDINAIEAGNDPTNPATLPPDVTGQTAPGTADTGTAGTEPPADANPAG